MSQQELLRKVIETLEQIGIDHMITGSVVSSLQGEPRSTHDIDIVVAIQETDIDDLVKAFLPPTYYLDAEAIKEALSHRSMFNLIDVVEGDKVDFWILTDQAFDQSRFARKYAEDVFGMRLKVSSPEDTILAKLQWVVKSGGSEKQFTDALRIFEVQCDKLDLDYLNRWVAALGVEELWNRLQDEAEIV
jgi:predicted nucleotidyltransferase